MVIISSNIQSQIQTLIEQYVDYRTNGEYGINAFWYWYYQVMNYLRNMDSIRLRVGFNLKYRMPKWGTVGYTKIVVGKDVIVYADTFIYSKRNLYNWLNHKSNRNPSYSVCDNCFGFKTILYDNSQKYAILKPDGKRLVKPVFDDIINFHHSSNDYNTLHAIGFINDRVYEISTDGNVVLLHMSKEDYLNAEHKFFEARQRQKIIEYKQYNTMNNTRNRVRLTESQLHNVIKESVKQVLSELDWKTYANASRKRKEQGKDQNAHDLSFYAAKQFQKKHNLPNLDKPYNIVKNKYPMDDYSYITPDEANVYAGEISPKHSTDYGRTTLKKHSDEDHPSIWKNGTHWNDFNTETDETEYYKDHVLRNGWGIQRGYKDLDDYYNGNYEYRKGKGWQKKDGLDESICRAIRKVLH